MKWPLSGTTTAAGIGPRALAAHRQAPAVTKTPIAADLHQSLDVEIDLTPEIALDRDISVAELGYGGFDLDTEETSVVLDRHVVTLRVSPGFGDAQPVFCGAGHEA